MMRGTTVSNLGNDRGVAIYEFALFIPVLLFIVLGGLEFSRSLKHSEVAAVISREATSIAYRMCSAELDPGTAVTCLESVRERIESFGNNIFPGTSVTVSIYRFEGVSSNCSDEFLPFAQTSKEQITSRISFISSFDQSGRRPGEIDRNILCQSRVLVVGEVFIPYSSPIPLAWFYSFAYDPKEFYDVAIM